MNIPKIIHYCWFGNNPLPELAIKCIESWKKYCPGYEIKQWNESNFDVNCCTYVREAYEKKRWAFVSDYARFKILYENGGLYFDTDVELIRRPDELMCEDAWFGWELSNWVASGLGFGAKQGHEYLRAIIREYESKSYAELSESWTTFHSLTGCPRINTYPLLKHGLLQDGTLQRIKYPVHPNAEVYDEVVVLPAEYLCPLDDLTGELNITDKTLSIHWYTKSANGKYAYYKSRIMRIVRFILKKIR
jgi:hypothetical protein